MNIDHHPCFNDGARHRFGRIHLPVASRCNIQCRFCNRKFDCVNESRPGVTSAVLKPAEALGYLDEVMAEKKNISVVGIAGPGDPFANAEETIETLSLVRKKYSEMLLCVASNGLNVYPYADALKALQVSHVTITVNAVDPKIASKVYAWVRVGKRVVSGEKGVNTLLESQIRSIKALKQAGITVKVNTIIIPGVNDHHIETVAERMKTLDVDILNCVAYYPNDGAEFRDIPEPSKEMVMDIRKKAGKHIKQMHHCTRCRADAVGLLGEKTDMAMINVLKKWQNGGEKENVLPVPSGNIAVASMEGVLINQHLGEANQLYIYGKKGSKAAFMGTRSTPPRGTGMARWNQLYTAINDCDTLLVSGIGDTPRDLLTRKGMRILEIEGMIEDAVNAIIQGEPIRHMKKRQGGGCDGACRGGGTGCG